MGIKNKAKNISQSMHDKKATLLYNYNNFDNIADDARHYVGVPDIGSFHSIAFDNAFRNSINNIFVINCYNKKNIFEKMEAFLGVVLPNKYRYTVKLFLTRRRFIKPIDYHCRYRSQSKRIRFNARYVQTISDRYDPERRDNKYYGYRNKR